ncbi:MAG: zinc ribbon domain-containing protein [Candidatus Latescibacteria bacterium]|jgi:putative FmdB family regulatory protein|nr:zinc ribbon domain-containing protein [Candidatus Latescibacterota bacterium]
MPIFEYHCDDCSADFEMLVRSANAGDEMSCPTCEGDHTTKKFSAFATSGAADGQSIGSPAAMSRGCGAGCGCHT